MNFFRQPFIWIGSRINTLFTYIGGLIYLGFMTLTRICVIGSPRRWRWIRSQIIDVGVASWIVTGVITLLMGMVIAFQTAHQLRQVGTEMMIPSLIAIAMCRELAPMMTALVVAGRAGAAMTAEIGSMKVTEQVEAMEVMSVSPVENLVYPRVLATMLTLPILTIYGDFIGLFGGYLVCVGKLGISSTAFTNKVFYSLQLSDLMAGLSKSFIFGAVISLVCCYEGLKVNGGAVGVGKATMRAVVVSFLMIVFCDFLFTAVLYVLPV